MIYTETRKIQKTVSGSYFVTLPKQWIEKMDLGWEDEDEKTTVKDKKETTVEKKNKELMMSVDEYSNLVVRPLQSQESFVNEFFIPIEDYVEENSLERCINSSYIQGADIISISSKSTIAFDRKRIVKDTVSNLIGTEISEEFSNRIAIRILVDPIKFPLANLIKRIYMLVASMHVDAIKSFQESDRLLAEDVVNREQEVDKLFFLMLRQLNLSLTNRINFSDICVSDMKIDCVLGIVLARDLSKMAHYAAEVAKESVKLIDKEIPAKLKEHIAKMSSFIIKMQQNAILAFYKNDFMRANDVLNKTHQVVEFDHQTENEVLNLIKDTGTIVSLITISRNLRNIATSAVAVSQDLQAKYRPQEAFRKDSDGEELPAGLDLIQSLGYEKEGK